MKIDYTLYLVTDSSLTGRRSLGECVRLAIEGGCTMIQLREKDISDLEFYKRAKEIHSITCQRKIPLIINNRVDIALSVNAQGVHIGQGDIPARVVRKIIGKDMLLGVSVHTLEEALKAEKDGADYLGVGAMFPTRTKPDAIPVEMEEFYRIRQNTCLPLVAIGGIQKENAGWLKSAGADGAACISAILAGPDIVRSAASIKAAFTGRKD